jgi:hypothetical protein
MPHLVPLLEFNPLTGKHFINSSELRMEIEKKPSASVQLGLLTGLLVSAMVTVIRALNLGPTAAGAKTAEHAMAIAGMFFAGIFAGTILFGIIRALRGRYARTLELALGIAVAVPVALISHQAGQTASTGPGLSGLWVLVAVLFWGATLGWAYQQLLIGGGTVAKHAGKDTVERIDRRRFLVRLGGATAVVIGHIRNEAAQVDRVHRGNRSLGARLLGRSGLSEPLQKKSVKFNVGGKRHKDRWRPHSQR